MIERRRYQHPGASPMETLEHLPALVVLERIPVPVLAVTHDGAVLFANTAFADMVGSTTEAVRSLQFHQIFAGAPTTEPPLAVVHAFANKLVDLAHADGSTVRALMSRSALQRNDDQIALATFQDLTERLWEDETLNVT